jgi:hypothetical protein
MDAATILVEAGRDDATPCGYLEEHAREQGEEGVVAIQRLHFHNFANGSLLVGCWLFLFGRF